MSDNNPSWHSLPALIETTALTALGAYVGVSVGAALDKPGSATRGLVAGASLGLAAGLFGAKKLEE